MINQEFCYHLSDSDAVFVKSNAGTIELFNKNESLPQVKIGTYKEGRWSWANEAERRTFFTLMQLYPKQMQKALKAYLRSQEEQPAFYTFNCLRRRFNIKVTKLERRWRSFMVNTFYGSFRN